MPLPVHSLGLRAGDILSQPEQLCVVTLWQLLRPGILVLKHGRSGKPKNRTLFCDDNLQVLFWRDADGTAGAAAAEYQQQHQHQLDIDRNKATRRSSFNVFLKQDSSREVVLRDVLEVIMSHGYDFVPLSDLTKMYCVLFLSSGSQQPHHRCYAPLRIKEICVRRPTLPGDFTHTKRQDVGFPNRRGTLY